MTSKENASANSPGTTQKFDDVPSHSEGGNNFIEQYTVGYGLRDWHIVPRALIAAVPLVGGSISVVVEDLVRKYERRQQAIAFATLSKFSLENGDPTVVNKVMLYSRHSADRWKPFVFAKLANTMSSDVSQYIVNILLDQANNLSSFEMQTLLLIAHQNDVDVPPLPAGLFELSTDERTKFPELAQLTESAKRKLSELGLIISTSPSTSSQLSYLGSILVHSLFQ